MLMAGLSRFNTDLVAGYINNDETLFHELMELLFNAQPPIPQRAAWVMSTVAETHKWIIKPYIPKLIDALPGFSHRGIQRCILFTFESEEIPKNKKGQLYNICFDYVDNTKVPVAVRVYAMQILFNISISEPELKNELRLLIESHYENGSDGFKSRARKILKKLSTQ